MKVIHYLLFSSLLMIGCNDNTTTTDSNNGLDNPIYVENGTLAFDSEAVFNETVTRLNDMNVTERLAFFDALGFKSQYCILQTKKLRFF